MTILKPHIFSNKPVRGTITPSQLSYPLSPAEAACDNPAKQVFVLATDTSREARDNDRGTEDRPNPREDLGGLHWTATWYRICTHLELLLSWCSCRYKDLPSCLGSWQVLSHLLALTMQKTLPQIPPGKASVAPSSDSFQKTRQNWPVTGWNDEYEWNKKLGMSETGTRKITGTRYTVGTTPNSSALLFFDNLLPTSPYRWEKPMRFHWWQPPLPDATFPLKSGKEAGRKTAGALVTASVDMGKCIN